MVERYSLKNIFKLIGIEPYEDGYPSIDSVPYVFLEELQKISGCHGKLFEVLDKIEYKLREGLFTEDEKDDIFYIVSYMA